MTTLKRTLGVLAVLGSLLPAYASAADLGGAFDGSMAVKTGATSGR